MIYGKISLSDAMTQKAEPVELPSEKTFAEMRNRLAELDTQIENTSKNTLGELNTLIAKMNAYAFTIPF